MTRSGKARHPALQTPLHRVLRRACLLLTGLLLTGLLLAGVPPLSPVAAERADPLFAWVQIGPGGAAQARAIVAGSEPCPQAEIDGHRQAMRLRAPAQAAGAFPVTSCQMDLPAGLKSLRVGGSSLPIPRTGLRRIAVIGDTGCRIKGDDAQACDLPAAWPFPALAAAVTAARPDLIVHLGDYLYRESPCPDDDHGCAGSQWGYNWGTWQADFFTPAQPMLDRAPFLFLRGNHETCHRAWRGWYRFLAETGWTPECHDYGVPYAVPLDGKRLIVLDTTHADDRKAKPHQVAAYADLLRGVNDLAANAGESWLATHKPFWSVHKVHGADERHPHPDGGTAVLQAAAAQVPLAGGIEAILSGHFHLFQAMAFREAGGKSRPGQLILGNGGTKLDDGPASLPAALDAWGMAIAEYALLSRFGFGVLEPAGAEAGTDGDWTLTLHDPAGEPFARCELSGRSLRCVTGL